MTDSPLAPVKDSMSRSPTSIEDIIESVVGRPVSSVSAHAVLRVANQWRKLHEQKVNARLSEALQDKRRRDLDARREVEELVARKVPFDILTKEWLRDNKISTDTRIYLLEKLIPTLVLGVEKLLREAERRELLGIETPSPDFNPINYLAQFLMRNNPRYSNFAESSPYAKGIRKMLDDLKRDAFQQEENKLAKMKAEAKKRKEEREKLERLNLLAVKGRPEVLQELFVQWVGERNGVISLSLVQSALRSFQDYVEMLPAPIKKDSSFSEDIGPTDVNGKMLTMKEFVVLVDQYTKNLIEEAFTEFLKRMTHLANEYRMSAQLETIRMILANLFIACDHGDTGLLDRKRVLKLLQSFYDNTNDQYIKTSLRNPREWPVIEIEEQEDSIEDTILEEKENKEEQQIVVMQRQELDTNATLDVNRITENVNGETSSGSNKKFVEETEKLPSESSKTTEEETKLEAARKEQKGVDKTLIKDIEEADVVSKTSGEEKKSDSLSPKYASVEVDPKMEREIKEMIDRVSSRVDGDSPNRTQSVATGSIFDPTTLNQSQFVNLLEKFLGDTPSRNSESSGYLPWISTLDIYPLEECKHAEKDAVEALIRYVRAGYIETEEERINRLLKARQEARSAKRRLQIDQLFDLWDIDASGHLDLPEVEMVLSKWREEGIERFKEAADVFEEAYGKISRKQFRKLIEKIVAMFEDEDVFDSLITFLFASVERSFEERKRGDFRKKWLMSIDAAAQTSGALLEPVYKATFQALNKDAEIHGRNKKISVYVAMLEPNTNPKMKKRGETSLRYVACTPDDTNFVLDKVLYRDMKCISFTVIDSGKPIHVPRVVHHGGVYLWNPARKTEGTEGSLLILPLKDHEKQVIGILGGDTLSDSREKAIFVTHEISFYRGVAKVLSASIQFIDSRKKTIKIAESAVSWILRRSHCVKEVNCYLVEPGLKATDGLVLRKMVTLGQNNYIQRYEKPPRLERKDNLFRDYLFKCIDTSETLTADAYGERHIAFPLRDADGLVVAIVDISIGELRQLPQHENKEILRMLKLLAVAHKEVSREIAGEEKNIVLEVEKEHQERRIDVLFDRIMLQDLRDNVGRLDTRAFAEIKSYKEPPKIIHDILRAVLEIYFSGSENEDLVQKLEQWTTCKQLVDNDLVKWITTFDPTAGSNLAVDGERLASNLSDIPPGAVGKHGSLPAQYLFNWAFVCLSLIEHTGKMREARPIRTVATDVNTQDDKDSLVEQKVRTSSIKNQEPESV